MFGMGGRRHEGHDAAVTQGGGVLLTNCTIVYSTLNFHRFPRVEEQCGMISSLCPINKMLNVLSETNLAMALMDRRRSQWDRLQMALEEEARGHGLNDAGVGMRVMASASEFFAF